MNDLIGRYDYRLPPAAIAQKPARPADRAKLLIYERADQKTAFDEFFNLDRYLPKNSVLVFNETKVVPARFVVAKPTGGKVELFYLGSDGKNLRCLADRPLKKGIVLALGKNKFKVLGRKDKGYLIRPSFAAKNIFLFLNRHGLTPLPPYLKHSPLSEAERRKQYQTFFARHAGSVAAPTASLHFTPRLMKKLKAAGAEMIYLTLHVNLGTFAPLTKKHLKEGKLHAERYEISAAAAGRLNAAKAAGKQIVAVGTTSARALESAATRRAVTKLSGTTNIFIRPPYKFKFVDSLITNFHVPRSSLLMLVAAMVGRRRLFALYSAALKKKIRFLSFGDGMLIK